MLATYYPGETMRITAANLTHADDGPVTTDATVTVTVLNADGTTYDTDTATTPGSGNDWFVDMLAPSTAGIYVVNVTATKDGAVWKGRGTVRVKDF